MANGDPKDPSNPSGRDPKDPQDPTSQGAGTIHDPPYGEVLSPLNQAKSETTAALATGIAGLIVVVLGCSGEFRVFLCLGSSVVVISMVLTFLARQNIALAQRLLTDATPAIRRAVAAAAKRTG
jgi:hypothetical protein